jgi:hypothetical protein
VTVNECSARAKTVFGTPGSRCSSSLPRLSHRTRSSVTYLSADSHAIVSLANDHNLEDQPMRQARNARHTESTRSALTDATIIRLSKIAVSLELPDIERFGAADFALDDQ